MAGNLDLQDIEDLNSASGSSSEIHRCTEPDMLDSDDVLCIFESHPTRRIDDLTQRTWNQCGMAQIMK